MRNRSVGKVWVLKHVFRGIFLRHFKQKRIKLFFIDYDYNKEIQIFSK